MSNKATLYRYAVSHPDYERVIVNAACPADATMEAATVWAAPWAKIAAYCRVEKLGKAAKPRCSRCGKAYGEAGQTSGLCPACLARVDAIRREIAAIPGRDRRAGMRR